MKAKPVYIYQLKDWPGFRRDEVRIAPLLVSVRARQAHLLGRMESIGFSLQDEANLQTLTLDVVKSSEIEGELLDPGQVRSSIARRLGMDVAGLVPADRSVEGVVEMMLDATQRYNEPLTSERLYGWQASLFPTGRSGTQKIVVGAWRDNPVTDPMQVISGMIGREKVHFQAPDSALLDDEMFGFLKWFNESSGDDPLIKAAVAHLWFVTIHPFDDGNGRIARAIADMQLARADGSPRRFYSMSAQIRKEKNKYYDKLEQTQQGDLDITGWLEWFLACLERALIATAETLQVVLRKAAFWKRHVGMNFNDRQRLLLEKILDGYGGKINSSNWAKIAGTSSDTAVRDINELLEKGILVKGPAGGRSTSYLLVEE
jgi:Fic family protein